MFVDLWKDLFKQCVDSSGKVMTPFPQILAKLFWKTSGLVKGMAADTEIYFVIVPYKHLNKI